jgi:hypothetical protein
MSLAPPTGPRVIPPTSTDREWVHLRHEHVARGVVTGHPVIVAQAKGPRRWDVDGAEYLDFVGGIGTLNVGHSHPRVIAAAIDQLQRFTHSAFQVAAYQPYFELAERLKRARRPRSRDEGRATHLRRRPDPGAPGRHDGRARRWSQPPRFGTSRRDLDSHCRGWRPSCRKILATSSMEGPKERTVW